MDNSKRSLKSSRKQKEKECPVCLQTPESSFIFQHFNCGSRFHNHCLFAKLGRGEFDCPACKLPFTTNDFTGEKDALAEGNESKGMTTELKEYLDFFAREKSKIEVKLKLRQSDKVDESVELVNAEALESIAKAEERARNAEKRAEEADRRVEEAENKCREAGIRAWRAEQELGRAAVGFVNLVREIHWYDEKFRVLTEEVVKLKKDVHKPVAF